MSKELPYFRFTCQEWATGEIDHAILEIKRRVENIKKNGDYFGSKTSFD